PEALDLGVRRFAEVVPDRRVARNHIRLIATVGDDVMRSLLNPQMFAAVIPANVHQLHRVERTAPSPRRIAAMRRLALERVFDRHETVAETLAPTGRQV